MPNARETLTAALATLVKESGIRHPILAQRIGVSDRTMRAYLSGSVFPIRHLDDILREIDVSPERFLAHALGEAMR